MDFEDHLETLSDDALHAAIEEADGYALELLLGEAERRDMDDL